MIELPHARPRWWRLALLQTLTGFALGSLIAFILLFAGHFVFPSVERFSVDIGIRLRVTVEHFLHLNSTLPVTEPTARRVPATQFVFLDVDPKEGGPSVCDRLPSQRKDLHCEPHRPLNRYMLAELIEELEKRGPKLIVLDIELSLDEGIVPREESGALVKEMSDAHPAPIIFASPVQWVPDEGGRTSPLYRLQSTELVAGSMISGDVPFRSLYAAVAFPEADITVRSFGTCVSVAGMDQPAYTLPWLAAALLKTPHLDTRVDDCRGMHGPPPRIIYTIPPLAGDKDSEEVTDRASRAFYRSVYSRCLAWRFWSVNASQCGITAARESSFYRDKVVVIGASSPERGDWHNTPLGVMNGTQVVINSIRSFLMFPDQARHPFGDLVLREVMIVAVCSVIWFAFHAIRCATATTVPAPARRAIAARMRRHMGVAGGFLLVLSITIVVSLYLAYHETFSAPQPEISLGVMMGVLGVALEQIVEFLHWAIRHIERMLALMLGIEHHD